MAKILYGKDALAFHEASPRLRPIPQYDEELLWERAQSMPEFESCKDINDVWVQAGFDEDNFDPHFIEDHEPIWAKFGSDCLKLEVESDTPEEDERKVIDYLRGQLSQPCKPEDWPAGFNGENMEIAGLSWEAGSMAVDRLVDKGTLVQANDSWWALRQDIELSTTHLLCDDCRWEADIDNFGLHRECAIRLRDELNRLLGSVNDGN